MKTLKVKARRSYEKDNKSSSTKSRASLNKNKATGKGVSLRKKATTPKKKPTKAQNIRTVGNVRVGKR